MITNTTLRSGPYEVTSENRSRFDFTFDVPGDDAGAIKVYIDDSVAPESTYSVTLSSSPTSYGYITFLSGLEPEVGAYVTIIRDVNPTQETDIQNQTAFYPEIIEAALDKMTALMLQVLEYLDRCLTYSFREVANGDKPTPHEILTTMRGLLASCILHEGNASTHAGTATTQAGVATTQAGLAQRYAAEAMALIAQAVSANFARVEEQVGAWAEFAYGNAPIIHEALGHYERVGEDAYSEGTVDISVQNGRYQFVETSCIDKNVLRLVIPDGYDDARGNTTDFIHLTVNHRFSDLTPHPQAGIYFQYGTGAVVRITELPGTYQVSFQRFADGTWAASGWSRLTPVAPIVAQD